MKLYIIIILLILHMVGITPRAIPGEVISADTIITEDGHEWGVETNKSGSVWAVFDTQGTPDVTDDTILWVGH